MELGMTGEYYYRRISSAETWRQLTQIHAVLDLER